MTAQIQITREHVDEVKIERCLTVAKTGLQNFDKVRRQVVEMLADMNTPERNRAVKELVKMPFHKDLIDRMIACAERGIVDAEHLYGQVRKATALDIKLADGDALKQIADPEHIFTYVDDNGVAHPKAAAKLNAVNLRKVWHYKDGKISEKEQRKRFKEIGRGASTSSNGSHASEADIISRVLVEYGGNPMWEITYKFKGASSTDTHVVRFPVKQVQALVRG